MTVTKQWWFCYHCKTYHTAACGSWFSRSTSHVGVSNRVMYFEPEWKIQLWSTGVSHITERRRRSE